MLADIVVDVISKIRKSGGTSRDRDQGSTHKSGSEKRKLKQAENEMLKKHTKITFFNPILVRLIKNRNSWKKELKKMCALVSKKTISSKKGNILDLLL